MAYCASCGHSWPLTDWMDRPNHDCPGCGATKDYRCADGHGGPRFD